MSNSVFFDNAVKLCCADQISGFIPVRPVVDTHEKIVEQRLVFLQGKMEQIYNTLSAQYKDSNKLRFFLDKATDLTSADMISGVIAVSPVSYERDERITETILSYFSSLWSSFNHVVTPEFVIPECKNNLRNKHRRRK